MSGRVRLEIIRFGLLLTVTVALISVAARHGDHPSSRNDAIRTHHQRATTAPSQSIGGGTSAPSEAGSTSPPNPSTPSGAAGSGASATAGTGAGGGASGGSGGTDNTAVATLPRTGGAQTVDLAALAVLLIAAGSFGMRISRPRGATGQIGTLSATLTQPEQARGSSESNRPATS